VIAIEKATFANTLSSRWEKRREPGWLYKVGSG